MHRSWLFMADSETDFVSLGNQQEWKILTQVKWLYGEYRF